ncbi:protein brambleberry-like [Eleutherodactylus coqui]|uniref:protein brambleberry-like n=1 Tax=Eleutherodactylus coqui TaxID=57060 RepID=UPI0034619698
MDLHNVIFSCPPDHGPPQCCLLMSPTQIMDLHNVIFSCPPDHGPPQCCLLMFPRSWTSTMLSSHVPQIMDFHNVVFSCPPDHGLPQCCLLMSPRSWTSTMLSSHVPQIMDLHNVVFSCPPDHGPPHKIKVPTGWKSRGLAALKNPGLPLQASEQTSCCSSDSAGLTMLLGCHVLLLIIIISLPAHSGALFGWFTRKSSGGTSAPQKQPAPDSQSLPRAPFEMTTTDDKFLAEAKHLELSPLDGCHYRVVSQLRVSCTEMSEEEIAKLGVSLFNCQAEVEERRTYPCTDDMTLAECTSSMDPDTWNAYHIVSNRARSVCYATRQLHFRRQTELTVNTLVSTAVNQLEAMKMLKDSQEELKELTAESLQRVLSSQNDLLTRQQQLQSNQEKIEGSIGGNLELLADEKALIASGHHLVADMIEGIARKMENVSGHLKEQDAELHKGHKTTLADLSEVRNRTQEIYSKIESNLELFLLYQNQSALYYEVLTEKLQRMNRSLSTVLYAMEHLHRSVEHRLTYIQGFITWAGGNLNAIYTCVLHGAYFLLLALLMTFLQTPGFSRAVLLVLIVLNALCELNHNTSLGFSSLTALLVCTVVGHWMLLSFICCLVKVKSRMVPPALPAPKPTALLLPNKKSAGLCCSTPEKAAFLNQLHCIVDNAASLSILPDDSVFGNESLIKDVSIIASPAHFERKLQCLRTPQQSTPTMKLRRLSVSKSVRGPETPLKLVAADKIPQRHLGAAFDALSESKNQSPNASISSNLSVPSSPRQFCQATTRMGQPCRNKASGGQEFCRVHASGQTSYITS